MSLVLPPFAFANITDNLTGTPSASTPGTNFTAGANNADGTSVSVLAAVGHDIHYLVVGIVGINTSGANGQCLLDVLVDPAGGSSWSELIGDLVCGMVHIVQGVQGIDLWYHFPLWIASGSSLGVRARTRHTANITTGQVVMYAMGNPSRPEAWWCGSKVESLGINAGTSQGTDVVPGNTGTFGSWTNIGSTTSGRYGALQFGINGSDGTAAALGYYFQVGYGSNQLPGSPTLWRALTTAENGSHVGMAMPIFCDVPEGTQMQIRGTSSGSAETLNCAIYGVY